ncbi:MAG: outer membrane beta-barrel protein [Saprospiraceae bacterium]|jgi:hypothetical protein
MKNLPLILSLVLFPMVLSAQFSIGLKGGVNTQLTRPDEIMVNNGDSSFNFGVDDFKFGTHFGMYVRIGEAVFIQPEVLFNSVRTDYRATSDDLGELVKNEQFNNLDIPILVGFTAGPIRVHGGPVGHYFLNSKSELTDINGYEARWKQMTWGWQAGLTFGTGRVSGDLRYEGNFNKYGDHINFFGDSYAFSNNPSRLVLSLNFALVK